MKRLAVAVWAFSVFSCGMLWSHSPHDDITAVALSADYARDGVLFAVVRKQLVRSTDFGRTWHGLERGLDVRGAVRDVVVATGHAGSVIYLAAEGQGVYRSRDGGTTWQALRHATAPSDVAQVLATRRSVLVIDTAERLHISRDDGETWQRVDVHGRRVLAAAWAPDAESVLVADHLGVLSRISASAAAEPLAELPAGSVVTSLGVPARWPESGRLLVGTGEGLFAVAAGVPGQVLRLHLPPPLEAEDIRPEHVTAVGFYPGASETLFCVTWYGGVLRSRDDGVTWERKVLGLSRAEQANAKRLPHFTSIATVPGTLVLAGFNGLFSSQDEGDSWSELTTISPSRLVGFAVSPEYAKDRTLCAATYLRGLAVSTDAAQSWTRATGATVGLRVLKPGAARLFDVEFSPDFARDGTLFALAGAYVLRSRDRGASWTRSPLGGDSWGFSRTVRFLRRADGTAGALGRREVDRAYDLALSPSFAIDGTLFVSARSGRVFRSQDGGESFAAVAEFPESTLGIACSPHFQSDGVAYCVVRKLGVIRTADGGESWQRVPEEAPFAGRLVLAVPPQRLGERVVFVGASDGLYRSQTGGGTWERIDRFGRAPISALAVSPGFLEDHTLLVSIAGAGLYRSRDGAESFEPVGRGLLADHRLIGLLHPSLPPDEAIRFSPSYATDRTVFAASGQELLVSLDVGETWRRLQHFDWAPQEERFVREVLAAFPYLSPAAVVFLVLLATVLYARRRLARARRKSAS